MKKLLYAFLLLLVCNSRNPQAMAGNNSQTDLLIQEDDSSSFKKNMMKHNIDFKVQVLFNTYKFYMERNGGDYHFIDSSGMEVEQWVSYNQEGKVKFYVDERHMTYSGYYYRGYYDAKGNMIKYTTLFHDTILKRYYFDSQGNLIKFEDYDSLFKFSINDLIMLFRRELNINIVNTNICGGVSRYFNDEDLGHSVYEVTIYKYRGSGSFFTVYLIHGDTGKIFFQQEGDISGSAGAAIENYIEQKAHKQKP